MCTSDGKLFKNTMQLHNFDTFRLWTDLQNAWLSPSVHKNCLQFAKMLITPWTAWGGYPHKVFNAYMSKHVGE